MPSASDNFLELKDCVFIRGFPANVNFTASDIRKYFNDRVGKCCVEMTALSKDKGRLFIVLKFDSKAAAQNAIERFSGKHVLNYKLRLNFWRAPINMVRSERSSRDSYEKYHQRWDHNIRSDKETEESLRHHKNSTREQNSHSTNHLPRNSMPYDDHVEFKKGSDSFRGFQQHTYMDRYETNDDFKNYQEKNEEYSQDRWSSDSGRERQYPVLDLDWSEWESNLRGSSENLSERGFYEREQEFLHPRGDKFWREREADQERRPELVDEDFTKDYDDNFFQCENYFEFTDNHHAHNERLSPIKAEGKRDQRGDRFCARNDREWFGNREFTEETRRNFPPSDQSAEWPRWETVALSNQTRKPFNLDVMKDTPTHVTRGLNPRVSPPPDGRPRSDEWVRNITRNFRSKDRHSASPVNIRSQTFGRAGSPPPGNTSSQTISDSARSRKGRGSISPVRNRHSTNGRSNRSSSVDKGFGSKTHESSPMNGRLSYSYNEHSFGRKTRESRSFSPNPNTKTSWPRGHGNNGKEVDLRRSFMMHQQGKHSSSRERDREVSLKHSPRRTRSSLEKYKVEPSSCRQAINRKRRNEDDLRRDDRTKRRRQTSSGICDNASSQLGNGNSDSTRKRHKRETDERIKLSPRDRERKARRSRDPAANNSNTRRADRFLSDLAVTLAQGKVLNKGPEANLRASKGNASTSGNSIEGKCRGNKTRLPINPASESEGSRPGERRYHEQEKAAAASDKNKQSSNVEEGVSCAELAMEGDNEESIIESEVSSCNEPSDQEEEEETDGNESSNLSEDDSERADSYENSISFEDDFLDVDEDLSSVIDDEIDDDMPEINDIDGDGTGECNECSKLSTGNSENDDHFEITGKGLQRNNSSSDEEFSKLNLAEELMEVVHTADLRDSWSPETLEKLDYVETLSEKENKTSHDDQVTNSDESFQELILKQEVKEHTENVIHEESMSTTAHHAHGDISSVQGKPPEWEEGKESCHLNAKSNMGKNASEALSVEVSSRTQVLNMSPDNVLTRDEDNADGSLCQKEEHEAMYRSKENYQEADVESVPEDITRDRTSSTRISCFPGTLSNTETDYRRDDKFNPQFIDRRSGPKVPLSVTSCNSTKDSSGPLNEGSYNEEKSYCNGSENLAVCTTESERVRDSIRKTKEGQYELKSNNRKHSNGADNEDKRDQRNVKSCDLDPLINNKSDVKTETSRRVLPLKKREDTITYATFQDKFLCKQGEVYIPGEARVARKEVCHNNEDGLVHNWNVKDVRLPEGSTSDREQDLPKEGAVVKNGLDGDSDDFEDHLGQEHAMHHAETLNDTKTKVGSRDVSNSREEKDLESRRRSEEVFPSVKDDIFSGTADLQRVDMEISLEGEIPDVSKELSLRVDSDTVAEDGDGNRPYSPSSPTWTSEEHRSPLPKDDMSLYSPSRPTSVSGSDAQRSIIVEDLSNEDRNYDGIEPVFDSMEVGCDLPEKENVTVNSGITKGPFTSSFIFCSSPKSESELLQGQSILDITEENILRRPAIPNSKIENRKVKDENGKCDEESLGNDSEILSNNPGTEKISKDDLRYMKHQEGTNGLVPLASVDVKPKIEYITATKLHKAEDVKVLLENSVKEKNDNDGRKSLRCQERTQSLPTSAIMDVIPKRAFVTSAKTYLVYTDNGTRHKPRIFYATNDTTARPARSLSLDTAWSSDENPEQGPSKASSNNEEERRQSAAKRADITIRREEENPDSLVEPSLSSGPCSWDSPLKLNGDMSEDGDQSVTLVRGLFVNLRSDNMAVLPDPGRDNCADARVTMSGNTASTTSSPSSGDIILAPSSDPGNEESLPIQTPLQPTDKEAPVRNDGRNSPSCLSHNGVSSDIQALCGTNKKDFSPATDHHLNTSSQVAKTTKSVSNLAISDISNDNLRPDEPSVTSVVTGNMPVACGRDDQIVSLLMCSDDIQSANAEMQGKNENDFQTEFSLGGIQRQASGNQNGDNTCHSTPTNIKRPRPDSSEEPFHTSKVARKALKLIMPTDRTPDPRGKANQNSALFTRYSKKTSSCTMTSADLAIVAERSPAHVVVGDALFTNKRNHVGNDVCAENDSSCRNISIDNRDSHTFKNDGLTLALKTGMSPPTTNIESHMQTQSFVADISVKDHTGTRILSDIEASCRRKETEQVAFKMEKLRKKKEEIEQVYKQECETVISVVKMLVRNDPRLEGLLQNAVRRTLQDMGRRCVQELEKQARPGT